MVTASRSASRTFAPASTSVSEARRFARVLVTEWGLDDVVDDVVLSVSELVTNAVMHAGTPATLEVRLEEGGVRLDVEDRHPSRMVRMGAAPSPETDDDYDEYGRGLLITAALAAAWGVEYRPHSKRVWALFASARPTGVHAPDAEPDLRAPVAVDPRPSPPAASDVDPLGLRNMALNRLAVDDLLALVVEQARERLDADASYLVLADGLDEKLTVRATSGLPVMLRGRTIERGEPGAPDDRSPFLPVSIDDLRRTPVDLLASRDLGSLVLAPVAFEGSLIGGLAVAREQVGGFTTADATQLQRAADWVAGAVDRVRLRAAERERRGWLTFLADASALLAGSLDPAMTMTMIGQIVVPRLATWCGIYLNDGRGRPLLQQVWHADEEQLDGVRRALEQARPDEATLPGEAAVAGEVTSIPLEVRARFIGWLTLGRAAGEPLQGELQMVADSIARRAAMAIDNAQAHAELHEIGSALQRSLLPESVPVVPGVDVGVVYESAGDHTEAGGDFYDFFPVGPGRWCFVVGDVCGTGPEAAAVTGMARHTVRSLMRSGFPVASTVERLNDAIIEEGERGRFLTLVCGTVESTDSGWYAVRLVCAGHPPPFVVDPDDPAQVRRIGRSQLLLGVVDVVDYVEEEFQLRAGERLVVVTDGVLERRDGSRMFDDAGVEAVLATSGPATAQVVAETLSRAVSDFADVRQSDDVAILVMQLGGAPDPSG